MLNIKKLFSFTIEEKEIETDTEVMEGTCCFCGGKVMLVENSYYLDRESYRVFCSKDCYLKEIEKDYY